MYILKNFLFLFYEKLMSIHMRKRIVLIISHLSMCKVCNTFSIRLCCTVCTRLCCLRIFISINVHIYLMSFLFVISPG